MSLVTGSSYLAILVPGEMFAPAFDQFGLHRKNLSRTLEDAGTCVVPMLIKMVASTVELTRLPTLRMPFISCSRMTAMQPLLE